VAFFNPLIADWDLMEKKSDEYRQRVRSDYYLNGELRAMDKKLHGMDGYLVSELIRQLVQIRIGELTSEEAKGTAWDKNRIFYVGRFGTTENLLKAMAGTLRQAVPKLVNLSPTLAEALTEIERTIQKIQCHLQLNRRPARMQKAFPSRQDATEVQCREARFGG
jgi:hypothetical protein